MKDTPHDSTKDTTKGEGTHPLISIAVGSDSDWPTMLTAHQVLDGLGIPHEAVIVSAHRTPDAMTEYAKELAERGIEVVIAGAGGAAHLPGMIASHTDLPVLGVPIPLYPPSGHLNGQDSLYSIVQMPAGIPVGTLAIGTPGAINAALLAARILARKYPDIADKVRAHRTKLSTDTGRRTIYPQ